MEPNSQPKIFIDADACPGMVKDVVYRGAQRLGLPLILVANRQIHIPRSPLFRLIVVAKGCDVADSQIVDEVTAGDLVITADIPLAARVIEKGAWAINPRGERYTPDNIGERLSMRNFLTEMRDSGQIAGGGPPQFTLKDKQRFAAAFDAIMSRLVREKQEVSK